MTWYQFTVAHQGLMKAQQMYLAGLPEWVHWWMTWMSIILGSSLVLAIWKDEARVVAIGVVLSLFASYWIGYFTGWNRLWGAAHLIFWTPALYFLVRWWPSMEARPTLGGRQLELTPVFKAWGALVIGTMGISLAFDLVDVVRYFASAPE